MTVTDPVVRHARELIEQGSKSFAGAARLFDEDTRASAYMLYAWCRHCDDEIDGQELGFARGNPDVRPVAQRLAMLQAQTRHALDGTPKTPVFEGLARVVEQHHIPHRHPFELLAGFEMDVCGRRYETIEDTLSYCYHVAGVVGVMMAIVMGVRSRETLERASDLGLGFQLTNIARDVIADAETGRLYLPAEWLAEAGVDSTPDAVAAPGNRGAVFAVTERLLDTANAYYASAGHGLARLPFRAAWAVAAARNVYQDIGAVVRLRGSAAWDDRAVVGRRRKFAGFTRAGLSAGASRLPVISTPPARTGLWTMPGLGE